MQPILLARSCVPLGRSRPAPCPRPPPTPLNSPLPPSPGLPPVVPARPLCPPACPPACPPSTLEPWLSCPSPPPFQDWVGQHYGCRVTAKDGRGWVHLLSPTPELWSLVLTHRTQILYIADISMACFHLELQPGAVVLESGTGSGSLTHSLARAVAPSGHVHTFEFHPQRAGGGDWGWGGRLWLVFMCGRADMLGGWEGGKGGGGTRCMGGDRA